MAASSSAPEPDSTLIWSKVASEHLERLRADPSGVRALRWPPAAGVMLILEPREHPMLEFVLRNFAHHLAPRGWGLQIVHSSSNAAWLRDLLKGFGPCKLQESPLPDFKPPIYNQILTKPAFWDSLDHEHILVFQTDTYLLNPAQLDEFLEYDYIGAPWPLVCPATGHALDHPRAYPSRTGPGLRELWPNLVGNGGLSLRRRSAMIEACRAFRLASDHRPSAEVLRCEGFPITEEDVFFAVALTRLGKKVAPREVALRFSAETVVPPTVTGPMFGLHRAYAYLPPGIVRALLALAV